MKHRLLLWTLMILYLGFMIGWIGKGDYQQESKHRSDNAWIKAWNEAKTNNFKCFLIIEELWCSDEEKLVELIYKNKEKDVEIIVGFATRVTNKPGIVWIIDVSNFVRTLEEPSINSYLLVRSRSNNTYIYNDCGYKEYKFKFGELQQ